MHADAVLAVFSFEGFTLDLARGLLLAVDGTEIALRPKALALLRHLVEHPGRLIDRDELLRAVWPNVFVSDDSIAQCVKEVRRALALASNSAPVLLIPPRL
jgi:DNA-binding winged helix-turn-helix (wHTH) protein